MNDPLEPSKDALSAHETDTHGELDENELDRVSGGTPVDGALQGAAGGATQQTLTPTITTMAGISGAAAGFGGAVKH
jgi:hypothetical protein